MSSPATRLLHGREPIRFNRRLGFAKRTYNAQSPVTGYTVTSNKAVGICRREISRSDVKEKGLESEMSFREDVFAKIVTYITVAVLLGAMLVEAFVIYMERREQTELEAQAASAQETINELSVQTHSLTAQVEELQEYKDKWENSVILADNELCQKMREDLSGRSEVIPEEAVEASLLAEEADSLSEAEDEEADAAEDRKGTDAAEADTSEDSEETELTAAGFSFPSAENKEWLLPLNLGNEPSVEYLFYARAEDAERGRYIDILFEVPVDRPGGDPVLDDNGQIIWRCLAYDAGLGWTLYTTPGEGTES